MGEALLLVSMFGPVMPRLLPEIMYHLRVRLGQCTMACRSVGRLAAASVSTDWWRHGRGQPLVN